MPIVLDTSSLIRFFTRDIEEKAAKVKSLLETEKVVIPDVVFPELEYILMSQYSITRDNLIEFYQFLTSQKNIQTSATIKRAVLLFEKTKLDIADCIIAASSYKGTLASFDRELLQAEGVTPYWK
ncbi:MAG: PIN domain-containing protein [Candidatus Levybacteria bacterium]|nr:PIN domain-containing protein [Candidatus Levybacteria bacterium]